MNRRFEQTAERMENLKTDQLRLSSLRNRKKIIKKKEESLRDLCKPTKHTNVCIMGVPEAEEKEKMAKRKYEETMF